MHVETDENSTVQPYAGKPEMHFFPPKITLTSLVIMTHKHAHKCTHMCTHTHTHSTHTMCTHIAHIHNMHTQITHTYITHIQKTHTHIQHTHIAHIHSTHIHNTHIHNTHTQRCTHRLTTATSQPLTICFISKQAPCGPGLLGIEVDLATVDLGMGPVLCPFFSF